MGRDHFSIGEVLELIKNDFPEVTVSKIRFLEGQGLLEPERTPSGYRKFYEHDLDRLRWILVQQRDHFLPLKVIKARLDGEDVGPASPEGDQIELPLGDLAPLIDAPPAAPPVARPVDVDLTDGAHADAIDELAATSDDQPAPSDRGASLPAPAAVAANGSATTVPADGVEMSNGMSNQGPDRDPGAWLEDLAAGRIRPAAASQAGTAEVGGHGHGAGEAAIAPDAAQQPSSPHSAAPDDRQHGDADVAEDHGSAEAESTPPSGDPAAHATVFAGESDDDEDAESGTEDTVADSVHVDDEDVGSPTMVDDPDEGLPMSDDTSPASAESSPWLEPDRTDVSLTRAELIEASGLSEASLTDLEGYGLITARKSGPVEVYGDDSLEVAVHAKAFYDQGLEARHLRMYLVSAQREAAFLENLVAPLLHRRNDAGRAEAVDIIGELGEAGLGLRDALLRGLLESYLTDG